MKNYIYYYRCMCVWNLQKTSNFVLCVQRLGVIVGVLVSLLTVSACGSSSSSGDSGASTILVAPTTPSSFGAAKGNNDESATVIILTWDSVSDATRYDIYSNNTNEQPETTTVSPKTSRYEHKNRIPGEHYYYWLRACNSAGCSDVVTVNAQTTAITAPQNFSVTAQPGSNTVELAWDDVIGANEFRVFRGSSADQNPPDTTHATWANTNYSDNKDISPDTTYRYWLQACYVREGIQDVCSSSKDAYKDVTTGSDNPPSDPRNLRAFANSNSQITLSWDEETNTTTYHLYRTQSNTQPNHDASTDKLIARINAPRSYYVDPDLQGDTTYYYWLWACNSYGCSAVSSVEGKTREQMPTAINDFTSDTVTATVNSANTITLQWVQIASATTYRLYSSTSNTKPAQPLIVLDNTDTLHQHTNLDAATTYYYWLQACNESGCSQDVSLSETTWLQTPTDFTATAAVENGEHSITLQWKKADEASGIDYHVYFSQNNSRDNARRISANGTDITTDTHTNLASGTRYYYWLSACKNGRCAFDEPTSSAITLPAILAKDTIVFTATTNQIDLSWDVIVGADSYHIYASNTSQKPSTALSTEKEPRYSHTGLESNTKYYYWLQACNESGCSVDTTTDRFTLLETPASFTATAVNFHTIDLAWSSVPGATSYRVYREDDTTFDPNIKAQDTSQSYDNLHSQTSYTYSIEACNDEGVCSERVTTSATTPTIPSPSGFAASAKNKSTIELRWTKANDSYITDYKIYRSEDATMPSAVFSNIKIVDLGTPTDATTDATTDANLTHRTRYYYWLEACAAHDGKCSDPVRADARTFGILNDTGITWAGNYPSGNQEVDCKGVDTSNGTTSLSEQDCHQGRDAHSATNANDNGHAGFHFTKLDSTGKALAEQTKAWQSNGTEAASTKWSCVHDVVTGLTWEVKTDVAKDIHANGNLYTWYDQSAGDLTGDDNATGANSNSCHGYTAGNATTYCNTQAFVARVNEQGLCGYSDWRVPDVDELLSIVNYDVTTDEPKIDTRYFPHTKHGSKDTTAITYWTASFHVPSSRIGDDGFGGTITSVVGILFANGTEERSFSDNTKSTYFVRLVRGERQNVWDDSRYVTQVINDDHVVIDTVTNLMWKLCTENTKSAACPQPQIDRKSFTWSQALAHADGHTFAGYDDWRIPNVKELASLVARDRSGPAINTSIFSESPSAYMLGEAWSSTPYGTDGALTVRALNGEMVSTRQRDWENNNTGRRFFHYVRLVRTLE